MHNSMHNPYDDTEEMIVAHMSPSEIKELSDMQGGIEHDPNTRLPSFKRLMTLMSHPSVKNGLIEWEGNKFAGGGEVEGFNQFLRQSGRFGDTEPVHLPRPLADLFDRALSGGRPSINPNTGKREYFLGGLLGGLGKIFSPVAHFLSPVTNALKPIVNTIAPFAGQAIQTLAPIAGAMGGKALGGMASAAGLGPMGTMLGNMAGNTLGGIAGNIGSQLAGGASPSNAARSAVSQAGQQMAPQVGSALGAAGSQMANQINNPYLRNLAGHAANMGGHMAGNMMQEGFGAMGNRAQPNYGQTAATTGSQYMDQFQHPLAQQASNMLGTYGQGYTPQQYMPQ